MFFAIMFLNYFLVTGLRGFILRTLILRAKLTGNKLGSCFNIKNKTKFHRRHDIIYLGTCPQTMCNERKLHLWKHALENNHQHVSEKYFKTIGNGFWGNNKKKKSSWDITNLRNQTNSEHSSTVDPIVDI